MQGPPSEAVRFLPRCHPDRSGPICSFAPNWGASGRGARFVRPVRLAGLEGSWQDRSSPRSMRSSLHRPCPSLVFCSGRLLPACVRREAVRTLPRCRPDRSGPIFSFAPNYGASGRGVEGSWQHRSPPRSMRSSLHRSSLTLRRSGHFAWPPLTTSHSPQSPAPSPPTPPAISCVCPANPHSPSSTPPAGPPAHPVAAYISATAPSLPDFP